METDQSPLLNGVYWDTWYNGENITVNEQNYIFYENKLLGVPRIRQLRVREGTCKVNDDFIGDITKCYADYRVIFKSSLFGEKSRLCQKLVFEIRERNVVFELIFGSESVILGQKASLWVKNVVLGHFRPFS